MEARALLQNSAQAIQPSITWLWGMLRTSVQATSFPALAALSLPRGAAPDSADVRSTVSAPRPLLRRLRPSGLGSPLAPADDLPLERLRLRQLPHLPPLQAFPHGELLPLPLRQPGNERLYCR